MEDMVKAADELTATLCGTRELLGKLVASAREKESVLQAEDVDGLNDILVKEEDIVLALKQNEAEREARAGRLAAAAGLGGEQIRLAGLIEAVGDPFCQARLAAAQDELAAEMERLLRQNSKVKELLQYKINYTDYMINLLYDPQDNLFSYDMEGNKEDTADKVNLLDYRA